MQVPNRRNATPIRGNHICEATWYCRTTLLAWTRSQYQMEGIAFLNPRCKDALCHYELAWPPGERPTRPQWTELRVAHVSAHSDTGTINIWLSRTMTRSTFTSTSW